MIINQIDVVSHSLPNGKLDEEIYIEQSQWCIKELKGKNQLQAEEIALWVKAVSQVLEHSLQSTHGIC